MELTTVAEKPFLQGLRKAAGPDGVGVYLVGDALAAPPSYLPFPIPKPRGIDVPWNWMRPENVFRGKAVKREHQGRHGLLWVGDRYYRTAQAFVDEATERRIVARRVTRIPRDFVLGETQVFLAHAFAIHRNGWHPGIFGCYLPTRVDLVVTPESALAGERLAEKIGAAARVIQVVSED